MNLRVEVTADDIRLGKRMNCIACPITRAVKRVVPRHRGSVWTGYYQIHLGGGEYASTTRAAQRFITKFDMGKPVKPFTFILKGVPE